MPPRKRELVPVEDVEPDVPEPPKWDLDLDELDAQASEALGIPPCFTIRANGAVFRVPSPIFMSDEVAKRTARVEALEDLDPVENLDLRNELARMMDAELLDRVWAAVEPHVRVPGRTIDSQPAELFNIRLANAILGEDEYTRFVQAGGSANRIMWAYGKLNQRLGSDPKQSTS